MPSRFWIWLADRLVAQDRRARAARKTDLALKKSAQKRAREKASLGRRLCSDPRRLERVAVVRRDTIAVLLEPEHPPVLRLPRAVPEAGPGAEPAARSSCWWSTPPR